MTSALLAALTVGFVGGPSSGGMAVTEMRLTNRGLIVGTWRGRRSDGGVVVWEFHRKGRVTLTVRGPDGGITTDSGTYRVSSRRLSVFFGGVLQAADVGQLDGRVLVLYWKSAPGAGRYRRR